MRRDDQYSAGLANTRAPGRLLRGEGGIRTRVGRAGTSSGKAPTCAVALPGRRSGEAPRRPRGLRGCCTSARFSLSGHLSLGSLRGENWVRTNGLRGFNPALFRLSYLSVCPTSVIPVSVSSALVRRPGHPVTPSGPRCVWVSLAHSQQLTTPGFATSWRPRSFPAVFPAQHHYPRLRGPGCVSLGTDGVGLFPSPNGLRHRRPFSRGPPFRVLMWNCQESMTRASGPALEPVAFAPSGRRRFPAVPSANRPDCEYRRVP